MTDAFFYLFCRWAFALNRMSIATGDPHYNEWAAELLKSVHAYFVYEPHIQTGAKRMHWKLSIDLKRPLMPSEGNLDPFDGLVSTR
jgi:hypothetical protein